MKINDIYMRNNDEYICKTYLARYMSRDWKNNPEETPTFQDASFAACSQRNKSKPYNNTFIHPGACGSCKDGIFIAVFIFFIAPGLLILSAIKKNQKREFDRKLALVSGKLWFEVKGI